SERYARVAIERKQKTLAGKFELVEGGTIQGKRELTASGGDCATLASSLAMAVAIGIDPMSLARPSGGELPPLPPPDSPPPPPPPPLARPPPPPLRSPPRRSPSAPPPGWGRAHPPERSRLPPWG